MLLELECLLGISLRRFMKLSCNSAVAKFSIDRIFDIPMPTILYWNQSHFVVLYRIDARRKNSISLILPWARGYWIMKHSCIIFVLILFMALLC